MLKTIVKENLLEARGIVGFYPASSTVDDIIVYGSEDTGTSSTVDDIIVYGSEDTGTSSTVDDIIVYGSEDTGTDGH